MKTPSLASFLSLVLVGCTSEAASSVPNAANSVTTDVAAKMLEQVKTTLAGITNADQAKAAAATLPPMVSKLGDSLKAVTGAWPAQLTTLADSVREQVARLTSMPDVKAALGSVLEQITALLPKK